ncbi:hypothetical protein BX070DRAFT_85664 [Coemansia spiralis]|nr:hypothetical protein BX070DRAFT_85664 [Coemansia spiralis]
MSTVRKNGATPVLKYTSPAMITCSNCEEKKNKKHRIPLGGDFCSRCGERIAVVYTQLNSRPRQI